MKLFAAILAQPRSSVLAEATALTLLIGFFDYITTWELSLFVFYAIPIFLVSWRWNRRIGIAFALFCGVVWFLANVNTHPYLTTEGYILAGINRGVYFIIVAMAATALKTQREETLARIEAMTRARALEQEIVRASEREQMRIGQDLHDGICQNLAAIDCATQCLKAELEAEGRPQANAAAVIQKMLKQTVMEARRLARGIFPMQMRAEGLPAALEELVMMTNQLRQVAITFEARGDIRIEDPEVAMHLYRIAQEALSNAMRHASASRVVVSLTREDDQLMMTIDDDGCGFSPNGSSEGMGLRTIRYRAQLIGAKLEIETKPFGGTSARCTLPITR